MVSYKEQCEYVAKAFEIKIIQLIDNGGFDYSDEEGVTGYISHTLLLILTEHLLKKQELLNLTHEDYRLFGKISDICSKGQNPVSKAFWQKLTGVDYVT